MMAEAKTPSRILLRLPRDRKRSEMSIIMGILFHGSAQAGITKLEPKKSTHGTYVYATQFRELALIFASRCGDDLTYTLYKNCDEEPWYLVERIPFGFETMFCNEASIYTVSDQSFFDINTGFSEVVSEVSVDTLTEEKIPCVYDAIKELDKSGLIKLYTYPNRPEGIPQDDSDLLRKEIDRCKRSGTSLNKNFFRRLLFLHPNLLELINKELLTYGLDTFSKNDIIKTFEGYLKRQKENPSEELYIKSASTLIKEYKDVY